jgi:hypothetical protein
MTKNITIELAFSTLNLERLNKAWEQVIARYPTLCEQATPYSAQHYDLREYLPTKKKQIQVAIRKKLQAAALDKQTWFSIITTQHDDNITCVHLGIVPNLLTSQEIYHLLREWQTLYENPKLSLAPITLNGETTETTFLLKPMHRYYEHFLGKLDHKTFANLRANSEKQYTSLPLALASVFRDELDKQGKNLPIYLTLANRFPLFPHMYDRASFATSINLFPLEFEEKGSFAQRCQTLETSLRQASLDLKPETSTILPEFKRPFALFTCTLDQDLPHAPMSITLPHILYSNVALPMVAVELQAWQYAGQLFYRWSYLTRYSDEEKIPSTDMSIFTPESDAEFNMNELGDKEKNFTDLRKFDLLHFLKQRVAQHEFNDDEDDSKPEDKEHLQELSDQSDDVVKLTALRINAKKVAAPIASMNVETPTTINSHKAFLDDSTARAQIATAPEQKKPSGLNVGAILTGIATAAVGAVASANTKNASTQNIMSNQSNSAQPGVNNSGNNANSASQQNVSNNANSNAENNFNSAMQQGNISQAGTGLNNPNAQNNFANVSQPMMGGTGSAVASNGNGSEAASSGIFSKDSIASIKNGVTSAAGSATSAISKIHNSNAQNNNGNNGSQNNNGSNGAQNNNGSNGAQNNNGSNGSQNNNGSNGAQNNNGSNGAQNNNGSNGSQNNNGSNGAQNNNGSNGSQNNNGNNGSLKNAFGDMTNSVNHLADEDGAAWAAEKQANANAVLNDAASNNGIAPLTDADRQAYQENLKKLPEDSPLVGMANTINSLKDIDDFTPPSINDIEPLDISGLNTLEEINAAAEAQKDNVVKLHQAPTKPKLATQDLNQKFADITGGLGANISTVQPELQDLGGSIDSFSQSAQSGDTFGAQAGISKITDTHATLVNKMSADNLTGVASDAPLVGASGDIASSAENVTDLASAQALQTKLDDFKTQLMGYQASLPQGDAPLIGEKTDELNAANNSPELLALQTKTVALQTSVADFNTMTCASICANKAAAADKVAALETSTATLAPTVPENPIDKNLDELTASTDQLNTLPPDVSADDPRFQEIMGSVQTKSESLSAAVSGNCPICRASADMPKAPTASVPNAELPTLTNPLTVPSLNLASAQNSLNGVQGLPSDTMAAVENCKTSLSGLRDQCNVTNPMANVGDVSSLAQGSADSSPYKKLQDTLNGSVDSLKPKIDSLQMCPAFTDASNGPSLSERMSGVSEQLGSMKDNLGGAMSGVATSQIQKFGNVRESLSGATAKFTNPDVKAQVADQLSVATATSGCMEALNIPAPSPGGPQTVVVSGFKLKCNFGSMDATVNIPAAGVGCSGKEYVKTPADVIPFMSVNCGMCKSMMNPQVAAATAAAMGTLVQQPCMKPVLALPIGAQKTEAYGMPVATKMTPMICPFGGKLEMTDPGQKDITVV